MNKDEFIQYCFYGYGTKCKKKAESYVSRFADDRVYTEDDYIEVYRMTVSAEDSYLKPRFRNYDGTRSTKRLVVGIDD